MYPPPTNTMRTTNTTLNRPCHVPSADWIRRRIIPSYLWPRAKTTDQDDCAHFSTRSSAHTDIRRARLANELEVRGALQTAPSLSIIRNMAGKSGLAGGAEALIVAAARRCNKTKRMYRRGPSHQRGPHVPQRECACSLLTLPPLIRSGPPSSRTEAGFRNIISRKRCLRQSGDKK